MSGANTIGRFVGQSPPEDCEPEESNPLAELMEKLQAAKEMFDHIKSLVETFSPKDEGEGGAAGEGGGGDEEDEREIRTPESLAAQLTALGARIAPTASSMEGRPPIDAARAQAVTQRLVGIATALSGAPGSPVDRRAAVEAAPEAARIAAELEAPHLRRQAVDNALTAARMRGASRPALEVLEKIKSTYEAVKGIIESAQKLAGKHGDGAFIKKSE
ncbi:MAG: hypothetical protein U0324_38445 [Polyangiales bacterium]